MGAAEPGTGAAAAGAPSIFDDLNTATVAEAAALYAARWRLPIHPLHHVDAGGRCSCGKCDDTSRGKHPRLDGWTELATTDEGTVAAWWREHPEANIGLALSPELGLLVLDIDGADADLFLAQLEDQHGELPRTATVRSGRADSPGRHLYFRAPKGYRARQDIRRDGVRIETKSRGNLVLPPSLHHSGRRYTWTVQAEPARAPEWLLDLARAPTVAGDSSRIGDHEPPDEGRQAEAADVLAAAWPGAGYGHDTCIPLAGALQLAGWPDAAVESFLRDVAARAGWRARHEEIEDIVAHFHKAAMHTGWPTLATYLGDDAVLRARALLGLSPRELPPPPGDEHVPWALTGTGKGRAMAGTPKRTRAKAAPRLAIVPDPKTGDKEPTPPPASEDDGGGAKDRAPAGRPVFRIMPGLENEAVDFAISKLAADPRVFVRERLVTVSESTDEEKRDVIRAAGAPVVNELSPGRLWKMLLELVAWEKRDARKKGEYVPCSPSEKIIRAIIEDRAWPGVRRLAGIVETPVLRADGTIHASPGYDDETGLYYRPTGAPPSIPANPTQDDARRAAAELLAVVKDFPWASDLHKAGWLAGLLTAIARPLCPRVPATIIDANSAGAGKSLLCEVIGIIATGRPMACGPWVDSDDEMRKRVVTHAVSGDSLVLMDNAPLGAAVGWAFFDAALTGTTIEDRILGETRKVKVPNVMTWYLTGNNITVKGDTARRAMIVRLDSPVEHPEERPAEEFDHPELSSWVLEHRQQLLVAALVILSAYLRAGCPTSRSLALGSFEKWSAIVRGALLWLGLGDVAELFASKTVDADPAVQAHRALLEALSKYPYGLLTGAMLSKAAEGADDRGNPTPPEDQELRDAIVELVPGRGLPGPEELGKVLRSLKDKVRGLENGQNARLEYLKPKGSKSKKSYPWRVAIGGDRGDMGGFSNQRGVKCTGEGERESSRQGVSHTGWVEKSPHIPPIPPDEDEDEDARDLRREREAIELEGGDDE